MRFRHLVVPILLALTACDNVTWGGTDVVIIPAPPRSSGPPAVADEKAFAQFGLPAGPVLFHLQPGVASARLVPVAEVAGDSLRMLRRPAGVSAEAFEGRFRETVVPPGAQFDVFRRGAHVGTFVVQGAGEVTRCGVPTATGNATVVAAATDASDFIAFRRGLGPDIRGVFGPPQINGSIRTYASIVAERLILQEGLPRPRSWGGAQRDLGAIEIHAGGNPEMYATYLVGDSLAMGPADPQGYSVFYLADYETRRGYTPVYAETRDYRQTGKAAPRFLDHLNWDGREGEELLIQVFGREQSWYEVLQQHGNEWVKAWEGPKC